MRTAIASLQTQLSNTSAQLAAKEDSEKKLSKYKIVPPTPRVHCSLKPYNIKGKSTTTKFSKLM